MYIVANSDFPGFSPEERMVVANLCRYHRKSTPQLTHDSFQLLEADNRAAVMLLTPLLRLAVALDQSQEQRVDRVEVTAQQNTVELRLHGTRDIDNEQWSAQQVAPVFHGVYGKSLVVRVKR
jgi:exopolyphosphatase/guanosine-5'-triphosphate,3'-diphosphate pyrophosphatase